MIKTMHFMDYFIQVCESLLYSTFTQPQTWASCISDWYVMSHTKQDPASDFTKWSSTS